MKEYRVSVNLSSLSNSTKDRNNLPLIQIVQERGYHRAIAIEQLIVAIIDISNREESRPEQVSVSGFIHGIRRFLPHGLRRICNRFNRRNILFRVEVWDGEEPGSPPLVDRRRRRRRATTTITTTSEGGAS